MDGLITGTKDFAKNQVEVVKSNIYEFSGCVLLSFVTHGVDIGGWEYAMAFSVVYLLHKTQLNKDQRFHGNPAFTFATWLTENSMSAFDVLKQVLFQIFGYAFGFWLGGVIGLTAHTSQPVEADFSTMIFNELVSVGVMTWLYLHVHDEDRNSQWGDFLGFAVGAAVWFGYKLKLGNAHLNSAIFAGEDFGKSIMFWQSDSWGVNDWVQFLAPLASVFITCLVYKFYHK